MTDEERDNGLATRTVCDGLIASSDWSLANTAYLDAEAQIEAQNLDCLADEVPTNCTEDRSIDGLDLADQCVRQLCAEDLRRSADNRLDDAVSWSLRFRDIYRVLVD